MKYRLFYLGILQILFLSCNSIYDYSNIYDYLGYKNGDIELVQFDDYITLGDGVAKVNAILGMPISKNITASTQQERWKYKEGTIFIKDKEVYGWRNTNPKSPIKLPVKLQLKSAVNVEKNLSLGADFWTAIALYGAPSEIDFSFIRFGRVRIEYGSDDLTFKNGKLLSYDNRKEHFDIHFDIKDKGNKTFTIGSTQEEVLSCQDIPSFIDVHESYSQWRYKRSRIYFDNNGIVTSWDNNSENLNLTGDEKNDDLVENQNERRDKKDNWFKNSYPKLVYTDENFVNLGDMKSDILKLLQEPITKTVSKRGKETWKYKGGTIYIKNDAVIGWYNRRGLLKVRHLPTNQEKDIIKLRLGSSFEDVLNRCGTPSEINLLAHVLKLTFGKETLYFRNNKLAGYSNAKGKFEFEFEKEPTTVCNGDLQIEVGTKSDDIYACFGMPIAISDGRRYTKWLYDDYRFTIKGGEVTDYSTR